MENFWRSVLVTDIGRFDACVKLFRKKRWTKPYDSSSLQVPPVSRMFHDICLTSEFNFIRIVDGKLLRDNVKSFVEMS